MRALQFRLFIVGLLLTFTFQPLVQAQNSPGFDKEKLDTYLNTLFEKNKMMGSVAIDSAGDEVYNKSLGFSHLGDQKTKADGETKYRIGSVTKTFTATIIMQLIEENKLSLSTKLGEFYPDLPKAQDITIEHLLRHQSGLHNFTNDSSYVEWMTEERSKKQLLDLFEGQKPEFKPGDQTSYSNTNYVLLGYIIEEITGESYANQLQKRIADPLNLEHTYYGNGIDPSKNEAASFKYANSQWEKMPETDMSIPGAAGAIVSTPNDMTDFIQALFAGKLVSQESLDKMTTIQQGLGLGLMKIPFYDSFAYGHNGGIDGFQSNLSYFPKENIALAVTANGLDHSFNDILIGVLSIYFGRDFTIPDFDEKPTITLTQKQMNQLVGEFTSDQLPMEISVFVKDSTLMAQATGQSAFPLTATNETTMRFDQAGLVMEFDSLKNGKYQQFTLNQGGGSYKFQRK